VVNDTDLLSNGVAPVNGGDGVVAASVGPDGGDFSLIQRCFLTSINSFSHL